MAQEHKHESAKQEDAAATKKAAEPAKSDAMKLYVAKGDGEDG